jgi:ribosome-associated protein
MEKKQTKKRISKAAAPAELTVTQVAGKKTVKRKTIVPKETERRRSPVEKDDAELKRQKQESLDLSRSIYKILDDKKAKDIKILDLDKVNPYFCYFVIASTDSPVQLKAFARELRKNFGHLMARKGSNPQEDDVASGWVVLDFFDVIVHLFLKEERSYYNLERLWGDAPSVLPE